MSSILSAQNQMSKSLADYVENERAAAERSVRAHDKWRSLQYGALAASATAVIGDLITPHYGSISSLPVSTMIPVLAAGAATYIAHQAWPHLREIKRSAKGALSGPNGLLSKFSDPAQTVSEGMKGLPRMLGLTSDARYMKQHGEWMKAKLGVDNLSNVKDTANLFYGKEHSNYLTNLAIYVREGIDIAVKDKLKNNDNSRLSFSDIETGILKFFDKHGNLGVSVDEAKGKDDTLQRAMMLITAPAQENMGLASSGQFLKIESLNISKELRAQDWDRNQPSPS